MTFAALTWLINTDPDCPADLLRLTWDAAVQDQDLVQLALIAAHPGLPADLHVRVAAMPVEGVRVAYLRRPDLPMLRVSELLAGETRPEVFAGLLVDPRPEWADGQVVAAFHRTPTWDLIKIVLPLPDLPEVTWRALLLQLERRRSTAYDAAGLTLMDLALSELAMAELACFAPLIDHVTDVASRSTLAILLMPGVLQLAMSESVLLPLLECPLEAAALEAVGVPMLELALESLAAGNSGWESPSWRMLIGPLLSREALPATVVALAGRVLAHPDSATLVAQGLRLPADALGGMSLRTTDDLDALGRAVNSPELAQVIDALHNPLLPESFARHGVATLIFNTPLLLGLQEVPLPVRWMLLHADALRTLTALGWEWLGTPAEVQSEYVTGVLGAAPLREPLSDLLVWRLMRRLELAHQAAPIAPAAWLMMPAGVFLCLLHPSNGQEVSVRDERITAPVAQALAAALSARFGADLSAHTLFFTLLGDYTGSLHDLLNVTALLAASPSGS